MEMLRAHYFQQARFAKVVAFSGGADLAPPVSASINESQQRKLKKEWLHEKAQLAQRS